MIALLLAMQMGLSRYAEDPLPVDPDMSKPASPITAGTIAIAPWTSCWDNITNTSCDKSKRQCDTGQELVIRLDVGKIDEGWIETIKGYGCVWPSDVKEPQLPHSEKQK